MAIKSYSNYSQEEMQSLSQGIMSILDDWDIPRTDENRETYSLVGRLNVLKVIS